jgi:hypothetical protein
MRNMFPTCPHPRAAIIMLGIATATLAGGCSNARTAETPQRQWVGAAGSGQGQGQVQGQHVAEAYKPEPGDPIKEAPVEPASRRAEPDDPTQPFSPNYGSPNSGRKHPSADANIARNRTADASE